MIDAEKASVMNMLIEPNNLRLRRSSTDQLDELSEKDEHYPPILVIDDELINIAVMDSLIAARGLKID